MQKDTAKSLSMWITTIGNTVMGGHPVPFDDIETDPDTLKKFTNVLFEDDIDNRWHPKIRELLVMTLLLRYDQYMDVLEAHPCAKVVDDLERHPHLDYPMSDAAEEHHWLSLSQESQGRLAMSTVRESLFLSRINQALERVCRYDDLDQHHLFSSWCKEARKFFLKGSNAVALPTETILRYGGDINDVTLDARCFIDHLNTLFSMVTCFYRCLGYVLVVLNLSIPKIIIS